MACKESLSEILKESLCPRFTAVKIEEEPDEAYLEGGLITIRGEPNSRVLRGGYRIRSKSAEKPGEKNHGAKRSPKRP